MNASEAHSLLGDATFLDVREPFEWDAGHVEGSLHIPMGEMEGRWEEVPREGRVVVVCHLGQRSALVANFLRQQGVDAHNLEGGLEAWVADGFDLVVGA
ncbi:MAG TPA: rhodanese-like domain-containing protein [Actinomycetota bacterium]|nr:rhodanese-like domain-containing protein [Actinomycetota bacterium]